MSRPRSGSLIWERAARMSSSAIVGSVLSFMFTSLTSAHRDGRGRDPRRSGIGSKREAARRALRPFSGRPSSTPDLAKRGTALAPATGGGASVRLVECLESLLCHALSPKRLSDCNDKYHINGSLEMVHSRTATRATPPATPTAAPPLAGPTPIPAQDAATHAATHTPPPAATPTSPQPCR
jgi:hypothetical protein